MGAVEELVTGLLLFDDAGGAAVSDQEKEDGGCDAFDKPAAVEDGCAVGLLICGLVTVLLLAEALSDLLTISSGSPCD
jgi:hypothetical protein